MPYRELSDVEAREAVLPQNEQAALATGERCRAYGAIGTSAENEMAIT
jgi:hypothetical protein